MQRFLIPILFFCFSCSSNDFSDFPTEQWKDDSFSCNGIRATLMDKFEAIKPKLLGKSEKDVIKVLGNADIGDLQKRHIKSFIYFIEPNKTCGSEKELAKAICVEFNSIGVVSIISEQLR